MKCNEKERINMVYSQFEAQGSGAVAGFTGLRFIQSSNSSVREKAENILNSASIPHKKHNLLQQ